MTGAVQTVTGPVAPGDLGRTLMHEHLLIAYPGCPLRIPTSPVSGA